MGYNGLSGAEIGEGVTAIIGVGCVGALSAPSMCFVRPPRPLFHRVCVRILQPSPPSAPCLVDGDVTVSPVQSEVGVAKGGRSNPIAKRQLSVCRVSGTTHPPIQPPTALINAEHSVRRAHAEQVYVTP